MQHGTTMLITNGISLKKIDITNGMQHQECSPTEVLLPFYGQLFVSETCF